MCFKHFYSKLLNASTTHASYFLYKVMKIGLWLIVHFDLYSYETSKTYGYLISPMKMRSFWEGKTYAKNTTSPLNLCYILERGLDLSILKIWGLLVKGLQSYQLSKLEVTRKSLLSSPGLTWTSSRPEFEITRGQVILNVWWPVTLQPFDLQTLNFQQYKVLTF